jgi:hypothetical protein
MVLFPSSSVVVVLRKNESGIDERWKDDCNLSYEVFKAEQNLFDNLLTTRKVRIVIQLKLGKSAKC